MDSPHTPLHYEVVRATEGGGVGQESFFFIFGSIVIPYSWHLLWGLYLSPLIFELPRNIFVFCRSNKMPGFAGFPVIVSIQNITVEKLHDYPII